MATIAPVIPIVSQAHPESYYEAPARILMSVQPPIRSSALRQRAVEEPEFATLFLGTAAAMDEMAVP